MLFADDEALISHTKKQVNDKITTTRPYFFTLIMDNSINFETETPWNMLFTDDEILINQTRKTMNEDLELWRRAFESSR